MNGTSWYTTVAWTGAAVTWTGTAVTRTGTAVTRTGTAVTRTGTAVTRTGTAVTYRIVKYHLSHSSDKSVHHHKVSYHKLSNLKFS